MALTFGTATAPLSITTYLDSVFATSLANYRKELIDNIGASNAFLYEILKGETYEEADGGTYIAEELLYGLTPAESYDGYDELGTLPTDGITQAIFRWRQMAAPIAYSMKEVIQNQHRLINLVKARLQQGELGIQESWAQAFMWGNAPNGGKLSDPRVGANGSLGIDPLFSLLSYNTVGNDFVGNAAAAGPALTVGGIPETGNPWWQNRWGISAATTYSGFVYEILNMYNTCALGTGGPPNLLLADQKTFQNFEHAYFLTYKAPMESAEREYPFVAKKFLTARMVMDDKVPDVYTGVAPTTVGGQVLPSSLTYGTIVMMNTRFFKVRYAPERNWELLKNEEGKAFQKPINGDSRVAHIGWMGNTTLNQRRKHGVMGKIARSYTS